MVIEQILNLPAAWFASFSDSRHTNGATSFLPRTSGLRGLKKPKVKLSDKSSKEPLKGWSGTNSQVDRRPGRWGCVTSLSFYLSRLKFSDSTILFSGPPTPPQPRIQSPLTWTLPEPLWAFSATLPIWLSFLHLQTPWGLRSSIPLRYPKKWSTGSPWQFGHWHLCWWEMVPVEGNTTQGDWSCMLRCYCLSL